MSAAKTATAPATPMTVDAFLDWMGKASEGGRYELVAGDPVAMPAEMIGHVEAKYAVWLALRLAVRAAGLTDCHVVGDGATVRIDAQTAYKPDALIYCGVPLAAEETEVTAPLVVVEVTSPGSFRVDAGAKLEGYSRLPSVRHYLLVHPVRRTVVHHKRTDGDAIRSRIVTTGPLTLDPPGLSVETEALFSPHLP